MNWKDTALFAGTLCVGLIGGSVFNLRADRVATATSEPTPAPVVVSTPAPAMEPPVEVEQQVAALQKELETQRQKSARLDANLQSIPVPTRRSPAQRRDRLEAALEASRAKAGLQDNDKLIAAGFTPERIKWLRHRGEERYSMALQATYERQHKGLAIYPQVYLFDEDLDLVKDIGEAEYDRYREALGRPLSAIVSRVEPGSGADRAGLRPGDEVIRYDGNRVYNIDQLKSFASESKPDGVVPVDVRRGGQVVQVSMSGGSTGVEGDSMSQIRLKGIEAAIPESVGKTLLQTAPRASQPPAARQ